MASETFRDKAVDFLERGVQSDKRRDFADACNSYEAAASHFILAIKYEKNDNIKITLQEKCTEILDRIEFLKEQMKKEAVKPEPTDSKDQNNALGSILTEKPNVNWSDIAGLEAAKDALKEAVLYPIRLPHLFETRLEPWKGILLYGPPGTGKTLLAKAVATQVDSCFFSVSAADLVSKWMGESERIVKALFETAAKKRPSIIFIDEIDSVCTARSENEHEASRRLKTQILQQMDGLGGDMRNILVLAATNLPWSLDPAVLRRFQRRVHIPLPDVEGRTGAMRIHLSKIPHSLKPAEFAQLAEQTEGFSGSDLRTLVQDARFQAVKDLKTATHFREVDGRYLPCSPGDKDAVEMEFIQLLENNDPRLTKLWLPDVSYSDFLRALKRTRPSVNPESLPHYLEFTEQAGQDGTI